MSLGCKENQQNSLNELPSVNWRLTSSFPKTLNTLYGTAEDFAANVSELTQGRFQIKTYQPNEIIPALGVFDAVSSGNIEMGQSAGAYYIGINTAFAFDTGLPFGMSSIEQNAWLYEGGGLELLQSIYSKYNIMYLPSGNTGPQMGGWFRKEINSLNDLSGLRMRIPGIGGKIMSKLNVSTQVLPGGEIYQALEKGVLDATEFIGPYDDEKMNFYEVAKYYYHPGWWEPSSTIALYINIDAWNKLPDSYKIAIELAAKNANISMLSMYNNQNAIALNSLIDKGVKVKRFPDEIIEQAKIESKIIFNEYAQNNEDFRKIYNHWNDYRTTMKDWNDISKN